MKDKSRFKKAKNALVFWTIFIGAGAIFGSLMMFVDPNGERTGMAGLLPGLRKLPFADVLFQNLVFSGIALLIVNGLSNAVASVLILKNKPAGVVLGGVFGVTLMLWICIQFFIFPFNALSFSYFLFGLFQAIAGYAACVFYKQENFRVTPEDYDNAGKNEKVLVVFFSRMGYVKKLAFEKAQATGGKLLEIRSTERTEGTLGFWWCGRFGMHRWDMPIEPTETDLSHYDKVIVCTPVWVFSLAAPVRTFCRAAKGVRKAEFVICHYSAGKFENVAKEMSELLGIEPESVETVVCRTGKYVSTKKIR